ncbi:high-affinity branched-chain amino acid ABC transporter permease LivM [Geopsychrobacter electrodiphilus]|uniref:high-affinity branched-chain amino acid ABC transporter permease LivM n=1 Tax=Geopsychrobacter electrodiphilus TaxID=225196 RepID=UPI00037804E7|nr:high-affinity branched-chain amino acid ABC transporter permease LivM [Geopsychrobacter electrodiphilus]
MTMPQKASVRKAVVDGFWSGLLALILFGPISGLILDGYEVRNELIRPLIMAIIVAVGRALTSYLMQTTKGRHYLGKLIGKREAGVTVSSLKKGKFQYLVIPVLILVGLVLPFILGKYWLTVVILAMIYVLLGLGLNIVVGLAGMLDLGYVAFYAVGAYSLAMGAQYFHLGFWTMLPFAGLCAALFGALLGFPVLRMHGDYLAIVTLGFGEIIRLILNNLLDITGGPNGASAPPPTLFGLEFTRHATQGGVPFHEYFHMAYSPTYKYIFIYLMLFIVVCLMILFVTRLKQMPMGRAWEALREDEIACRSLGINHVTVKLSAFMMGAMVGGIAGVFFATYQGFINPSSFTFFESALILAIVVLGGLGSTVGVIIAALVLTILPEVLRDFAEYRVLLFGLAMVLMMLWKPRGLIRIKRKAYDIKEASL